MRLAMAIPLRSAWSFALLTSLVATALATSPDGQPEAKKDEPRKVEAKPELKPPQPTAAEVKVLGEKLRVEREEAIKAKFPPEALARADDYAKRAESALANNNLRAAARYYRDARWQLPYLPVNLPPHIVRVFGESRMRHPERVNCVAYSPDGGRLASASADNTVKVWDLGNGREL